MQTVVVVVDPFHLRKLWTIRKGKKSFENINNHHQLNIYYDYFKRHSRVIGVCTVFKEYVISNSSDEITFDTTNQHNSRDKNRKENKNTLKIFKSKTVGVQVFCILGGHRIIFLCLVIFRQYVTHGASLNDDKKPTDHI